MKNFAASRSVPSSMRSSSTLSRDKRSSSTDTLEEIDCLPEDQIDRLNAFHIRETLNIKNSSNIKNPLDVSACFGTLSSLLKGDSEHKLKKKHFDAILQLESYFSSNSTDPPMVSDEAQIGFQRPSLTRDSGVYGLNRDRRATKRQIARNQRFTNMKKSWEAITDPGGEDCKFDKRLTSTAYDVMAMFGAAGEGVSMIGGKIIPPLNPRQSRPSRGFVLQNKCQDNEHDIQEERRRSFAEAKGSRHSRNSPIFLDNRYCPREWRQLTPDVQAKLANLLSWDNLAKWDFNVVEVGKLTNAPLLFVGWSIICAQAQDSMEHSLLSSGTPPSQSLRKSGESKAYRYDFEDLKINPRTVCNFLREVESRYKKVAYHNNIHAADVTQSLHCLFQLMGKKNLVGLCDPIAIFSLLLAATFHDIGHPGTNNLFQQNALTDVAIEYNDVSVLENMHAAVGHSLLMGEKKNDLWDIFKEWTKEDKLLARSIMVSSIMGTDMSGHFAKLEKLGSLIEKVEDDFDADQPILSILVENICSAEVGESNVREDCSELAEIFVKFLLHAADISNPAKVQETCLYWTDNALEEFFDQGDQERDMGLPISPLCDKSTVTKPDSQIGFIKFIVIPTFEMLGEMIPRVREEIMPILKNNLEHWNKMKSSNNRLGELADVIEED